MLFWLLLPPDPLPPLPRLLFDEFIAMLVLMDDVMSDHEWSQSQVGTPSALSEIGTQIRKVISSGGFLKDDEGINIEKTNRILLSPFSQLPQLFFGKVQL